ncbi:MAG TPA: molybdopterin-synthase adenylyltransferase MoeB [Gemmatimonadaceae bacterium]|jgi:adenylyltransferase/sulfurtransferase
MTATGTEPVDLSEKRDDVPELSTEELQRYSRHLLLPEVGLEGQRRLKAGRALLVGAGGLGSPLALYLAAAGVGHIGIVDFDVVDVTNLQRQVLHGTRDIGRPKLDSARDRLGDINPHVQVETYETRLTSANALEIIRDYDLVVDGTDNFPTRYLVNDACVLTGTPNVYGSIFRFEGQASVFATADGPCYRCLFREPPPPGMVPSCAEGGVLGVLPGLIGTIQATEALKLLLGIGTTLVGRLLLVDALRMQFRTLTLRRDPECPACGTRTLHELIDYEEFCGLRATHSGAGVPEVSPAELVAWRARGDAIDLVDVREPGEWALAHLAGARHVPLGALSGALDTFARDRTIVCYCKGGARSAQAARQLRAEGFDNVWSLTGGILRWRAEVDPTLPGY